MPETYREIADSERLPEAPVTSALVIALDDNSRAIAEGASGAPKVQGAAVALSLGAPALIGSGLDYINLGRVKVLRFDAYYFTNNTARTLQVAFSNDNGATFGSAQNTIVFANNGNSTFFMYLDLETGDFFAARNQVVSSTSVPSVTETNTTLTVPANCNAVRFTLSTIAGSHSLRMAGMCVSGVSP